MKRNSYGKTSDKVAKVAIGLLVMAILAVIGYVAWQFYNMPEYATEREIKALAEDYWENYYYDKFVENLGDNSLEEAFSPYEDHEMAPVKLRQLLLFDNGRHESSKEIFDSPHYQCNTNSSSVTYQPYAPFGKKDYSYEVNLSCKEQ